MTEELIGQKDKLRAHKLTGALYVVSNFLHDNEPLKWQMRQLALQIESEIDPSRSDVAIKLINRLVNLLDVALLSSAVSEMNLSILKQEYLALSKRLEQQQGQQILEPLALLQSNPDVNLLTIKTESKSKPESKPVPVAPAVKAKNKESKGQSSPAISPMSDKTDRVEIILRHIRENGESSIKDIATSFPTYSTKTVQRALANLVHRGLITRQGDRRWSRYSLIDSN